MIEYITSMIIFLFVVVVLAEGYNRCLKFKCGKERTSERDKQKEISPSLCLYH